ncbi:TPA: hypothetical protein HA241_00165 [Candidatus Woesearchaeota archaeon]|nr:hypothetical protein [Candidatus Woesearchaeota archaeon]
MALRNLIQTFKQQFALFQDQVSLFVQFIIGKYKNFRSDTVQEQVACCTLAASPILIIVSIILFIVS